MRVLTKDDMAAFLAGQEHGVLSTLDRTGIPAAATVAFSETPTFDLLVGTAVTSEKYANVMRDPRVAMTVTDTVNRLTMQYQGWAAVLTDEEFAVRAEAHFAKLPGSRPFRDMAGQAYLLIHPLRIKFSDCAAQPWRVEEFLNF